MAIDNRKLSTILSREEAKAQNLMFYFTGNPCNHGHICNRLTSSSKCVRCRITYEEKRRKEVKGIVLTNNKDVSEILSREDALKLGLMFYFTGKPCERGHVCRKYTTNCCCFECKKNYDNSEKGREIHKNCKLKREYGISISDYNAVLEFQNNCCGCCGMEFDDDIRNSRPCTDHNHKTGQFRKIICNSCNLLIGIAQESTTKLLKAIAYLNEFDTTGNISLVEEAKKH